MTAETACWATQRDQSSDEPTPIRAMRSDNSAVIWATLIVAAEIVAVSTTSRPMVRLSQGWLNAFWT